MLEHIVAWSPMVMFRGLLGGSGERYAERFRDALERAVAERAPLVEQEYRFQLQDGYHWLYSVTRLVYGEDGELVDTLGYAMDVTERRQADEAVRERAATLQVVVKASPDIISIFDAEGRVRSMSPAIECITGRRADDAHRSRRPGAVRPGEQPQQGSTFWVELPLVEGSVQQDERERPDEPAPGSQEPEPAGPTLTILDIEDNLSNLQPVERVLSRRPGEGLISAMRPSWASTWPASTTPTWSCSTCTCPTCLGPLDVRQLLELLDAVAAERQEAITAG
jgi:PAS domain-containing protein